MKKKKILVIDDDSNIRLLIKKIIDKYLDGVKTFEAANGFEGLELYDKHHPDITIFDLNMPNGDGFELIDSIAGKKRGDEAFVAMTGESVSQKQVSQLYSNGIDIFIRKGFYNEELAGIFNSLFQKIGIIKENYSREREYRILLDSSPDGYILFDMAMKPVFWNQQTLKLSRGLINKELYQTITVDHSYFSEAHRDNITGMITDTKINHSKNTLDLRLPAKDNVGQVRHIRIEFMPILDTGKGTVSHYAMIFMDMTQSYTLRDRLQDNIKLLDKIARTLPFVIYLYDIEKERKSLLNVQAFKSWGIDIKVSEADDWINRRLHPDDRDRVRKHYDRPEKWHPDELKHIECRFRKDNGEYIWIKITDIPFGERLNRRNKQLLGSIQNINEYREILDRLHTSTYDIETILSTIDDAIWSLDQDMHLRFYNEGFLKLWNNFFPNEPLPQDLSKIDLCMHPLADFIDLHKSAQNGETIDFQYTSKQKENQYFDVRITPIDLGGKIIGTVGMMSDVSQYVVARQALEESRERLILATKTANIGIFEWNLQNNEIIWNDSMYDIYEKERVEFKLTYRSWLSLIHPADRDYVINLRKTATLKEIDYTPTFRIRFADEKIKYIQPSARVFWDEEGDPIKLVGVNLDITETKEQEQELNTHRNYLSKLVEERTEALQAEISLRKIAEHELEKALDRQVDFNKQKNKFVQMISHEFRTPLTQIMMSIDLLDMLFGKVGNEIRSKSDKYVDIVKTGVDQMTDILSITGKFFYMQEQLVYPLIYSFDFFSLINKVVSNIINSREVDFDRIEIMNKADDCTIESSEDILYSAFHQILDNAMKYSPDDSKIQLKISESARGLKVTITDKGKGILPDDLPYVTDLFRRGSDQDNIGGQRGLGIGLSIAKLSFDSLKCRMSIKSEYGKGTTVNVNLRSNPDIFRNKENKPKTENKKKALTIKTVRAN